MNLKVKYLEGTRFEISSRSHVIISDQPPSEGGTDQGMTPIELLVASLASCVAYYASVYLKRRIKNLNKFEVRSSWQYLEDPHRIGSINLTVISPSELTKPEINGLIRSVDHCTIKNTLKYGPNVKIEIKI